MKEKLSQWQIFFTEMPQNAALTFSTNKSKYEKRKRYK